MNVAVLLLIITLFLYVLFVIPFRIEAFIYAGMLNESFALAFKIANISVFASKLEFIENELYITTKSGKIKKVQFSKGANLKTAGKIVKSLAEKKLELSFYGGVSGNEFHTSMLCGTFASIAAVLAPAGQKAKVQVVTNIIKTADDELTLSANFSAKTSIARTIFALIFKK